MSRTSDGVIARKSYPVPQPDGSTGLIILSLADPEFHSEGPWALARQQRGEAFGLIGFEGIANAPRYPLVWIFLPPDEMQVIPAAQEGTKTMPVEIQVLIDRYLPEFFDLAVVPELSMLEAVPLPGCSGVVRH
jgi:hypothetical protein